MSLEEVYAYLEELNKKYPPFDPQGWIPPSFRLKNSDPPQCHPRQKDGYQYRNITFNKSTKTFTYEMKAPNERWSGPFHGRKISDFYRMEETPLEEKKNV